MFLNFTSALNEALFPCLENCFLNYKNYVDFLNDKALVYFIYNYDLSYLNIQN